MIATGSVISQRYEILDLISGGGMAEVFRARRIEDGEVIALKILRQQYASDADFITRFER